MKKKHGKLYAAAYLIYGFLSSMMDLKYSINSSEYLSDIIKIENQSRMRPESRATLILISSTVNGSKTFLSNFSILGT
jgi:hypothetical protein